MTTVLLVRHGRTAANVDGVLAGRTTGVSLDDQGVDQARRLAERLAPLPVAGVVTSPLQRCRETAAALMAVGPDGGPRAAETLTVDDGLTECDYGRWTGGALKSLAKDPLWKAVQSHPSSVTFPDGESMRAMGARAVDVVRSRNASFGPDAVWVAVSHGDVIKAIVADALSLHLDEFQRIQVDPCSVSVITYTPLRPFVVRLNDTGGSFDALRPRGRTRRRRSSDAAVGGGSGEPT